MLFCSSVAVVGSVMPAGAVSEYAACEGWKRLLIRSITTTTPAANNPEIRAMSKIWRAESLYIKPSSLSKILDLAGYQTSVVGCSRNGRRCERLYQRRTAEASFVFSRRPLNEEREERVGQVSEIPKNDDRRLPTQGHAACR